MCFWGRKVDKNCVAAFGAWFKLEHTIRNLGSLLIASKWNVILCNMSLTLIPMFKIWWCFLYWKFRTCISKHVWNHAQIPPFLLIWKALSIVVAMSYFWNVTSFEKDEVSVGWVDFTILQLLIQQVSPWKHWSRTPPFRSQQEVTCLKVHYFRTWPTLLVVFFPSFFLMASFFKQSLNYQLLSSPYTMHHAAQWSTGGKRLPFRELPELVGGPTCWQKWRGQRLAIVQKGWS